VSGAAVVGYVDQVIVDPRMAIMAMCRMRRSLRDESRGIMFVASVSPERFEIVVVTYDRHGAARSPRRSMTAVSGVVIVRHVDRSIAFGMAKYGNTLKCVDSD
jgi:hypothetical protein